MSARPLTQGVGLGLLGALCAACSGAAPPADRHFDVTLNYDGSRFTGGLSFPDGDTTLSTLNTSSAAPVKVTGTVVGGYLPIDSAQGEYTRVSQRGFSVTHLSYTVLVKRSAEDDASFANAQPPQPFAQCVVSEELLGHAAGCLSTRRNCSITLTEVP